jgi:cob(I)alamin adenosyltransferase
MKIYTKTGDTGTTGLFAGPRVVKSHPRISAYGTVDELNASLGIIVASLPSEVADSNSAAGTVYDLLQTIQSDLFSMGAELATPDPVRHGMRLLTQASVDRLERSIDAAEEQLPPLTSFVLPGGSICAAQLHLSRTICRRAEREIVHLGQVESEVDVDLIVIYLNRLSDLLFVLARFANIVQCQAEIPWKKPAN